MKSAYCCDSGTATWALSIFYCSQFGFNSPIMKTILKTKKEIENFGNVKNCGQAKKTHRLDTI